MLRIAALSILAACGGSSVEPLDTADDDLTVAGSHLPRQEGSQVDRNLQPSAAAVSTLQGHADTPHPWTDVEIDALIADMRQQIDLRVALSSAQYLLSALQQQTATDAQRTRA